jgi:hypothetical protein
MIFRVSLIIFLVAVGIWLLWALPYTNLIAGIAALVAAIASAVERQ